MAQKALFTLRPAGKNDKSIATGKNTGMLSAIARFETVSMAGPAGGGFEQAGGHSGAFKEGKRGRATLEKAIDSRELEFYERAERGEWPLELIPKFYGRNDAGDRLVLENLTDGMSCPCVADLKMGMASFESTAVWQKKLRMRILDQVTNTRETGVRLEGLSMHRTLDKLKVKGTKQQSHMCSIGRSLDEILAFFLTDRNGVRLDVAHELLLGVEKILLQFKKNTRFRFIGSSILLIYDNNNTSPTLRWARALEYAQLPRWRITKFTKTKVVVRMIDFAHFSESKKQNELDEGYLQGLETLQAALLEVLARHTRKPRFAFSNVVETAKTASGSLEGPQGPLDYEQLSSSSDEDEAPGLTREASQTSFDHIIRKGALRSIGPMG